MNLEEQLLVNFHEQFAENQNHLQQSFIQVLSVILTVLIGYGYIYSNGGTFKIEEIKYYDFNVALSFCVATLINTFGILLVCSNAHSYRRDQFVVSKIRRKAGIINERGNNDKIFPYHFDPAISLKVKREIFVDRFVNPSFNKIDQAIKWFHYKVSWMPNFYNILFFILVSMQFGLLLSVVFNPYDSFTVKFNLTYNIHWSYLSAIIIWIILTLYSAERANTFMKKLEDLYNNN